MKTILAIGITTSIVLASFSKINGDTLTAIYFLVWANFFSVGFYYELNKEKHIRVIRVILSIAILVALSSCSALGDNKEEIQFVKETTQINSVFVYHDDERAVTCWLYDYANYVGGISCMTDKEIENDK